MYDQGYCHNDGDPNGKEHGKSHADQAAIERYRN